MSRGHMRSGEYGGSGIRWDFFLAAEIWWTAKGATRSDKKPAVFPSFSTNRFSYKRFKTSLRKLEPTDCPFAVRIPGGLTLRYRETRPTLQLWSDDKWYIFFRPRRRHAPLRRLRFCLTKTQVLSSVTSFRRKTFLICLSVGNVRRRKILRFPFGTRFTQTRRIAKSSFKMLCTRRPSYCIRRKPRSGRIEFWTVSSFFEVDGRPLHGTSSLSDSRPFIETFEPTANDCFPWCSAVIKKCSNFLARYWGGLSAFQTKFHVVCSPHFHIIP